MADIDTPSYMDAEELAGLLSDPATKDTIAVVDCRDSDRREGGWIVDSIHFPSQQATREAYDSLYASLQQKRATTVVFHCMFSQSRGPGGAASFVSLFPSAVRGTMRVVILRGGFRGFYAWARHHRQNHLLVESGYSFL